jgi:hypothetical protein
VTEKTWKIDGSLEADLRFPETTAKGLTSVKAPAKHLTFEFSVGF